MKKNGGNEIERRLANKAGRVCPTQKGKGRNDLKSDADDKEADKEGFHHRREIFRRHKEVSPVKEYTEEQVHIVSKVLNSNDLYHTLGVEKTATERELNKAYRKLALQMHPDKNKAPGATEAFQAIGNAFDVLKDKERREKYDQYGPEMEINQRENTHRNAFGGCVAVDSTLIIVISLVVAGIFLVKAISVIVKKLKRQKKKRRTEVLMDI